jgi:hypothetical protein
MAFYAVSMLRIAFALAVRNRSYMDLLTTFLEHLVRIAEAMDQHGIWDESDGFYYDALRLPDGSREALKVHTMVGLIPLLPAVFLPEEAIRQSRTLGKAFARFLAELGEPDHGNGQAGSVAERPDTQVRLLSIVSAARLKRILQELLDEAAFLGPHGLRAVSRRHLDDPVRVEIFGIEATIDYEPGESTTNLFGGNSNWRGPVWFPVNFLVIESLQHWDEWFGEGLTVECPTGSGHWMRLQDVARELGARQV